MAYSVEIKNNVRERLEKGQEFKTISEELNISVSTIYNWKKECDKENESKESIEEEKETSKEIRKLIKLRQFNEALQLIVKYPNNVVIQSQRINILIYKGKLEEAKRIGYREEFRNNEAIQSQMITIAIKEGNLEEAKRIGNREKFRNNGAIQSQMITIAIKEGNLEEAKRIEHREELKNYAPIQSQMIAIAIKEENLEEAKRIGYREEFRNNGAIQSQIMTIAKNDLIVKSFNTKEKKGKQPITEKLKFLNKMKRKIYYDKIERTDINEIENNRDITDYERICLLLAIYEKQKNIKKARELVKKYKTECKETQNNKTWNAILQRIESKKAKIFDIGFYDELLHWEIDENSREKYEQEIKRNSERKGELGKKRAEIQARVVSQEAKKEYEYTTINDNRKKHTRSKARR